MLRKTELNPLDAGGLDSSTMYKCPKKRFFFLLNDSSSFLPCTFPRPIFILLQSFARALRRQDVKDLCLMRRARQSVCPRCSFLVTYCRLWLPCSCSSVLQPCAGVFRLTIAHSFDLTQIRPYKGRQRSSSM